MEDIEAHERHVSIRDNILGQRNLQRENEKEDLHGSVNGMKKTETGRRSDGQGRPQRMGGMFAVDHAGIALKMDMEKHHNEEKAKASTDLFSQMIGHSHPDI